MALEVETIINSPIDSNCFILYDSEINSDCIIVDPGSINIDTIIARINYLDLNPKYIILTHEHFDHIFGCEEIRNRYDVQLISSRICSDRIVDPKMNLSLFYDQIGIIINKADICVEDVDMNIDFNGHRIVFYDTHGHTDSGISFLVNDKLFTGDTLIPNLKTVTKLKCGSKESLKMSMELYRNFQGKGYTVYPGHGDCFELDLYDTLLAM